MNDTADDITVSRPDVRVLADYRCHCGENPLWDDRRGVLYWTDIPNGRLFRWTSADGGHRQIYQGGVVGGFTLQQDGSLLLFGDNRISLLRDDGSERVLREQIEPGIQRFNDVIADPRGRVYAGTMGRNMDGGLYLVDTDGSIRNLFRGTNCANGMAFSPNVTHFYWTCSTTRQIYRFSYSVETGELSDREVLIKLPKDQGLPDGMTVDEEGNLWSARWEGGAIWRYAPDGTPVEQIELPVKIPSSVAFGGRDFRTLFVTTAGGQHREADDVPQGRPAAGTLLSIESARRGRPEFRSCFPID